MNLNGNKTDIKGNEWPYNLLEQVGFEDDDPLDHLSTEGELWLAMCMSRMTEREMQIVRIRYFEQNTLKETGEIIGITQERVRQIEAKAVRKLRNNHCGYVLRYGARAYIEKRVNEKVDEVVSIRLKELEDAYREKMADVVIRDNEDKRNAIDKLKATTVGELHMGLRPYNCLTRAGVHTVGELMERYPTYQKVTQIRNLGRKSLEEIVDAVQELGFAWPVFE